jgi:hypothetical protein
MARINHPAETWTPSAVSTSRRMRSCLVALTRLRKLGRGMSFLRKGASRAAVESFVSMKGLTVGVLLLMAAAPAFSEQKSCAELAGDIAVRLEAKGDQLDIVDADEVGAQTVVGTCEGGAKKITYRKITTSPARS